MSNLDNREMYFRRYVFQKLFQFELDLASLPELPSVSDDIAVRRFCLRLDELAKERDRQRGVITSLR